MCSEKPSRSTGLTANKLDPRMNLKVMRKRTLMNYSRTCLPLPLKKKTKNWLSRPIIAKCRSKVLQSILQYFRPLLSYHLSVRTLFNLFLSGRFRQVLLYQRKEINQVL